MLNKDRTRIGVMFSPANPPHMIEFLVAMQAMAEFLLEEVLYVVNCARSGPPALADTVEHRLAMAKGIATAFGPMITVTDLDAQEELVLEPTRMADGQGRLRVEGEDYAFRVFRYNPKERLTLVFIAGLKHYRRTDDAGKDDTVNKLLLNIKQQYYGFNPDLHNVIALFVNDGTREPADLAFSLEEQNLIDRGLFAVEILHFRSPGDLHEEDVSTRLTDGLKDLLNGTLDLNKLAILPMPVLKYLGSHMDCIQRLIESRSDLLE